MTKVFIDGSAGTTGLRIHERLSGREGLELIALPPELRKDAKAREEAINAADIAFFCLPDAAAAEAEALVHGDTAVIDTSTASRSWRARERRSRAPSWWQTPAAMPAASSPWWSLW